MREWTVIGRREFIERVRTRWFIFVTLLAPVGMVLLLVVPAWLAVRSAEKQAVIQVVDRTGRNLIPGLVRSAGLMGANLDLQPVPPDTDEALLLRRIRDETIDGFLVLPASLLAGGAATYRGDNATNLRLKMVLAQSVNAAAFEVRARDAGIPPETLLRLGTPTIDVVARHDTGRGETESPQASLVAGVAVMFLLYFSIVFYAVNVMRSVVQEKSSRVVELIVSAVKPASLMLGKLVGVGAVGLLQLGIWAAIALALLGFRGQILGIFGISGSNVEVPPLGAVDILVILAYFVLGFLFYSALHAAIGAMVNTDQEGQQLQMPLMVLLMIPILCLQLVANDPRGGAAQVLTLLPFSSPVLMPMRHLLGGASPAELAISLAILVISIAASVVVAGRIYRVGILMYGKRPSLAELARWIRYS